MAEWWHELDCIRCGYSLRGLQKQGRCPECGLDVHESLVARERKRRERYARRERTIVLAWIVGTYIALNIVSVIASEVELFDKMLVLLVFGLAAPVVAVMSLTIAQFSAYLRPRRAPLFTWLAFCVALVCIVVAAYVNLRLLGRLFAGI